MTKFDYFLGSLLALFGIFMLTGPIVHWSAIVLYVGALMLFILFVMRTRKERCGHCGHYFHRTIFEKLAERKSKKRCIDCLSSANAEKSGDSQIPA